MASYAAQVAFAVYQTALPMAAVVVAAGTGYYRGKRAAVSVGLLLLATWSGGLAGLVVLAAGSWSREVVAVGGLVCLAAPGCLVLWTGIRLRRLSSAPVQR